MPSFRDFFRSKPRSKSAPPASRHTWPRLRRSQSTVIPLTDEVQPLAESEEITPVAPDQNAADQNAAPGQDGADDDTSCHDDTEEQPNDLNDGSPSKRQSSNIPQSPQASHNRNEGSDQSQPQSQPQSQTASQAGSQRGSKRIKDFISRFRLSRSQDRSSVSEPPRIPFPQDAAGDVVTTDPIKKDIPSRNVSVDDEEPDILGQHRNVSAQTAQSQDSSATVYRHPSQRIPMPMHELQEDVFWASLLNFRPKSQNKDYPSEHPVDPSDPFSDGKIVDGPCPTAASSHYSGDRSQRKSHASSSAHNQMDTRPSSKSHSSHHTSASHATRISSISSQGSRMSRFSRVDPSKAAALFDALVDKLNLTIISPIASREDEAPTETADGESESQSRSRRRFGRVRPTQSNATLGETSAKPTKLRRTKTFANLTRRSSPMSSLRGKPIEDIARLGGHSYLILSLDLAPAPLQLPACIVAMVMYLKKAFPKASPKPPLFQEPGDLKAATRLYNHFASQVLLAERDASRIAMTMRVVALPSMETQSDTAALLSVGWVFKEILAGLPNGILGSLQFHKVLHGIYLAGSNPYRVRLITFALMALTSEMQCALICGVFGLFTSLLQVRRQALDVSNFPGDPVRQVASHGQLHPDELARVFAPLLIGRRGRPEPSVEQEIEEQRVMEMLLEYWPGISRLLWDLTESSPRTRKQENED